MEEFKIELKALLEKHNAQISATYKDDYGYGYNGYIHIMISVGDIEEVVNTKWSNEKVQLTPDKL